MTPGRYRILREIGRGGNGHVYLAMDEKLGVFRVIKKIIVEQSSEGEYRRQQLIREIHTLKELNHPRIPKLMDVFHDASSVGIIMEYVEGKNLKQYVQEEGRVREELLLEWAWQLSGILSYLHGRNPPVIHRDLKPSNVILHSSGEIYLIDFGIAQDSVYSEALQGSYGYAAPEQCRAGGVCDGRTDIYGMGRVLCFCLCGNPDLEALDISRDLYRILEKCTDPDPDKRYDDIDHFREDIHIYMNRNRKSWFSRKKYAGYLVTGLLPLLMAAGCVHRELGSMRAKQFVTQAQSALDSRKMMKYYKNALENAPWLEEIYLSMADDLILQNHFTTQEAVEILDLLNETGALTTFERQNADAYARFCYKLGIGYFYEMGGVKGKQEAALWFGRALDQKDGLSIEQSQRASCYEKIGQYYGTFLVYGEEESKEGSQGDYREFYETLGKLLEYARQDTDLYGSVACEVSMELKDHISDFMEKGGISGQELKKLLNEILVFCRKISDQMDMREKEKLETVVAEAKKSIQIMEENDEKEIQIIMSDDSSGELSVADDESEGTGTGGKS